jgi:hypothetical protein
VWIPSEQLTGRGPRACLGFHPREEFL